MPSPPPRIMPRWGSCGRAPAESSPEQSSAGYANRPPNGRGRPLTAPATTCTIWYTMLLILLIGAVLVGWWSLADAVLVRRRLPPPGDPGRFVTVDGVTTYYRVQGQGPALVLLHGLGSSHLSWEAVEPALAAHFTVYTLDLPGFGYSDKPAGYGSARHEAAFVDHFLATLGVARATVVGHSMGGAAALWLAAEHPARVERLVVVNAAGIGPPATIFRVTGLPIVGELLLKLTTPASMRALMGTAYLHKQVLTPALAARYARFAWTPGAQRALVEHARGYDVDRAALRPALAQISVPTLIVWTDRDPYFSLSVARDLQRALSSARLEILDDTGHIPQEEQPDRFAQVLLQWALPVAAMPEPRVVQSRRKVTSSSCPSQTTVRRAGTVRATTCPLRMRSRRGATRRMASTSLGASKTTRLARQPAASP